VVEVKSAVARLRPNRVLPSAIATTSSGASTRELGMSAGIGNKVPSDIGLHDFPPLVVEKVPKVKTYKFFITENQIVLVSPQKEVADIIK
jgi:hypothetical protein